MASNRSVDFYFRTEAVMDSPRQVFDRLSSGIGSGDWSGLYLLYAEEADVSMPFLRPGPVRIHGREEVR